MLVFYCLAGTTLINEVRQVFLAADHSLEEGRKQVSRIVSMAAGLSIEEANVEAFRRQLNENCTLTEEDMILSLIHIFKKCFRVLKCFFCFKVLPAQNNTALKCKSQVAFVIFLHILIEK